MAVSDADGSGSNALLDDVTQTTHRLSLFLLFPARIRNVYAIFLSVNKLRATSSRFGTLRISATTHFPEKTSEQ